jgi:hypothetical protein
MSGRVWNIKYRNSAQSTGCFDELSIQPDQGEVMNHRTAAAPLKEGLKPKTITLHGRITLSDIRSIMNAMRVIDDLFITHQQTARNAKTIALNWMPHQSKNFQIDEFPDCYWLVTRTS